ncbi:hypothetical protein [Planctomicrobium piriforme]|uniref:Uncharacterized protein n=1 Tax=Planctomicrobium piriforme TaxID=1576369 RepID=A0A1I3NI00_9PLAN|nr:hypothetical protein [Planctomicrobium piriforme]SFJ08964.1 hypothetical protein SAMN05421753_115108 [Planctomicrobium piriforme]
MMASLRTWCRRVAPPAVCVWAAFVFWLFGAFGIPLLLSLSGLPLSELMQFSLGRYPAVFSAGLYGVYRVAAFHPFFRPKYRQWLEQTPWHGEHPLPLGPVHLVTQDFVFILVGTLLTLFDSQAYLYDVAATFMTAYLAALALGLAATGQLKLAYVVMFGLGAAMLLWEWPILLTLSLCALYFVAANGLRISLDEFDRWNEVMIFGIPVKEVIHTDSKSRQFGWPFDQLSPGRFPFIQTPFTAFALALLAGWWALVILLWMPDEQMPQLISSYFIFALSCIVFRTVAYAYGYYPPLSLDARLRLFRWIIAGYDQIFIAPFLILLAIWGTSAGIEYGLLTDTVGLPALVFVSLLIAIGCPPTLEKWRLTGEHRIAPTSLSSSSELVRTQ